MLKIAPNLHYNCTAGKIPQQTFFNLEILNTFYFALYEDGMHCYIFNHWNMAQDGILHFASIHSHNIELMKDKGFKWMYV